MKYYLTSNPIDENHQTLCARNQFTAHLQASLPKQIRLLFVCSDPDTPEMTDPFANEIKACFIGSGFELLGFTVLDGRNAESAETLVKQADCIFLAGGHVPTQNKFFYQIKLAERLNNDNDKIVIGFSAGSMNCAAEVYALPEEEGEAVSPSYQRFLPGLGISGTMVLPHYQAIRDQILDGRRLFEDIAYPDSMHRRFYAINDGSYIYGDGQHEILFGEGYLIKDGILTAVSKDNETYRIF